VRSSPLPLFFPRAGTSENDAAALALVRAELPRVERLLGRMLGPRSDLDDLVQSVFVEACRAFAHYRGQGTPGAFIGGIAVRVARRAMRGSAFSRHRAELADDLPSAHASPEEAYTRAQLMQRLRRALEKVAPKKRIAFTLWALEGLEVSEIATLTGVSVAATRSRIFYAQKALKELAARDPVLREALGDKP
jgi:RNA polymerase sigma-70 factor, ECF subfamily